MMAAVNSQNRKEQRVKNALRIVLLQETKGKYRVDDGSGKRPDLEYAQAYATAALGMRGEMLKVQVGYVLNNLQYWRGNVARKVKLVLRKYREEK